MAIASIRRNPPPEKDLLDSFNEAEEKVLPRHWPKGKPSGDGISYFDKVMQIRVGRLRWRSRIQTGREIVWLAVTVVISLAIVWHQFLQ
jgi:hypothetical protein